MSRRTDSVLVDICPDGKFGFKAFSPAELGLTKAVYDLRETVRETGTSRTLIYYYIKTGKLRRTKIGRKTVFLAVDIAEFLSRLRG